MDAIHKPRFRNNLLSRMSQEDQSRLLPHVEFVSLPRKMSLSEPDAASDFTYFPESGIGSVVMGPRDGRFAEVGIFGREGLAPTSGISGTASLPYRVSMQIAGDGHRVSNVQLQAAMGDSLVLRNLFARYVQSASVQFAYTAYSTAVHQIEARLARWLLMYHDRADGNDIALTHEFLGLMLAVRRQSVTTTLHILEGKHLIAGFRGFITIRDRAGLKTLAGDAYGVPEREYQAIIGYPS